LNSLNKSKYVREKKNDIPDQQKYQSLQKKKNKEKQKDKQHTTEDLTRLKHHSWEKDRESRKRKERTLDRDKRWST